MQADYITYKVEHNLHKWCKYGARNLFFVPFLLIMGLLSNSTAYAQYYTTGDPPASAKWRYIKGENYKIIYPSETDSLARRYLYLLEYERDRVMVGLKISPKPVPVIINPYTAASNGVVVWAPKRMELYTQPPAVGGYAHNWESQLVLHESRHVGQITHFTKGIYKPLGWLLGEQSPGLGVGVYASKWFLEGDAVIAETELSNAGRGRSASFLEYYRASYLSGSYRSWQKWRFGSYRYFYPNHYALGYLLNSTMRIRSGNYLVAGELLENYVKYFYNPDVRNYSSKKTVGLKQKDLHAAGARMYADIWRKDFDSRGEFTEPKVLQHRESGYYYEYSTPVAIGRDSVVYIRWANDRSAELVMLSMEPDFLKEHKKGERILRSLSYSADALEVRGSTIYWIERVYDVRWGKRAYNELYSYDIKTGRVVALSRGTSYNNPALSECEKYLSVVEYPVEGGSNLVILNAVTGEKIYSVPAPENGQLTESAWIGETLYALAITEKGLGLFSYNIALLESGMNSENVGWQRVINEQHKSISRLGSDGRWLYFESDLDGVGNIYFYNPQSDTLKRVTNAKFAAHDPHFADGRLYYTDLQIYGRRPVYIEDTVAAGRADNAPYMQDGEIKNGYVFEVAETLSKQAQEYFKGDALFADKPESKDGKEMADMAEGSTSVEYESRPYKKVSHLFRFHSWAPVYYNAEKIKSMSYDKFYDMLSLGATIYSQNSLGTATTMLGYSYRNGYHAAHTSFEYSGLYPVFKITADYNASDRFKHKVIEDGEQKKVETSTNGVPLFELSALAYVPFNLSRNGWQRGIIPQIQWNYENNAFYSNKNSSYVNRQQVFLGVRYYQMQPVTVAAIYPRWGFGAEAKWSFSPNGRENFGEVFSGYTYFYLPGAVNSQGIRMTAAYQKQFVEGKWYYLDNLVSMPRGYDDLYGKEYYRISMDYAIAVNFAGLDLGWLAYLKRLQIIPFADIAAIKGKDGKWYNANSYGCDLLMDGIYFRIGAPVSFGIRYARAANSSDKNYIGVIANVSMF